MASFPLVLSLDGLLTVAQHLAHQGHYASALCGGRTHGVGPGGTTRDTASEAVLSPGPSRRHLTLEHVQAVPCKPMERKGPTQQQPGPERWEDKGVV